MLKEAIEKIVSLAENNTYVINGETYSDKPLVHIPEYVERPSKVTIGSLDGLVKLIKTEIGKVTNPVFVHVADYRTVNVFTTYDDHMTRDSLYTAVCAGPDFKEGFRDHTQAIIELRSRFVENDGSLYLLDLLSRISVEDNVTSEDNGVSQTVAARQGVALKQTVIVKPIVKLRPYRTFPEVEQPESEFLLRLDDQGKAGLMEADGKVWTLAAKKNIAEYFKAALSGEISAGTVVVME